MWKYVETNHYPLRIETDRLVNIREINYFTQSFLFPHLLLARLFLEEKKSGYCDALDVVCVITKL